MFHFWSRRLLCINVTTAASAANNEDDEKFNKHLSSLKEKYDKRRKHIQQFVESLVKIQEVTPFDNDVEHTKKQLLSELSSTSHFEHCVKVFDAHLNQETIEALRIAGYPYNPKHSSEQILGGHFILC